MSKDPAILFYTGDFLTGTMTMTNEHVGMYARLLFLQHQKHPNRLSDADMIYICTTYVEDVYKKFKKDECGFYYNERMELEINKRVAYSDSRRKNIKKRYDSKKSTYVLHMENENEDSINSSELKKEGCGEKEVSIPEEKKETPFDVFWKAYPRKVGKGAAVTVWRKIREPSKVLELALKAIAWQKTSEQWTKDNGQFIPHPATWLNQGRWEDQPVETFVQPVRKKIW